jgi:hypothetical protein
MAAETSPAPGPRTDPTKSTLDMASFQAERRAALLDQREAAAQLGLDPDVVAQDSSHLLSIGVDPTSSNPGAER